MFQDDHCRARSAHPYRGDPVARAYDWPPIPTLIHGWLLTTKPAAMDTYGLVKDGARFFIAQCPKTLLVHLEVHDELQPPSIDEFLQRARLTFGPTSSMKDFQDYAVIKRRRVQLPQKRVE